MEFRGKRSGRTSIKQLSADPRLIWCIHRSAEKKRRSPGEEICHLITVGIQYDPEAAVYGSVLDDLREHSTSLNLPQPTAIPRKAPQAGARKSEIA